MYNKLYEKIKDYIRENRVPIIIFALLYILFTFPLPYYIYTAGGTMNIDDKVTIDGEYKQKGSFGFSYVNELKGTIPLVALSFVMPNWELIKVEKTKETSTESLEEVNFRNKMFLIESIQNATMVVYNKLNKDLRVTNKNHYVVYIDSLANTNLKVKEEILEANNILIDNQYEYTKIVNDLEFGNIIDLKVKDINRDIKIRQIEVLNYKGVKITGIYIITKLEYEAIPKITYNFAKQESGPSGGLMLALTIYNKLTKGDITKGLKIVGTGTIDEKGNIGSVSGIDHKLKGAVNNKVDLFLVPNGENYDDAVKLKEKNKYNINIIGVTTFEDALSYLELL